MKILSIDPGTHTGWAFVDTEAGVAASFVGSELVIDEQTWLAEYELCENVWQEVEFYEPDRLVVEDFILLPKEVKGGMSSERSGLSSPRVASMLFCMALERGWADADIYWQMPGVMKVITSDRLKNAGMWVVGSEHARDAAKHLLIHLRKHIRRWND